MPNLRVAPIVALLAVLAALSAPAAATASCMMPPALEEAVKSSDVVFVGTVTSTTNRNTWAEVQVDEIWRGPDLPARVVVKGGPEGNAVTSVDRSFEVGVKYLFVPYVDPNGGPIAGQVLNLQDNSCSSTTPWTAELAPLRPADTRQAIGTVASDEGFDAGGLVAPLALALVVAVALVGAGLLARGRQSD